MEKEISRVQSKEKIIVKKRLPKRFHPPPPCQLFRVLIGLPVLLITLRTCSMRRERCLRTGGSSPHPLPPFSLSPSLPSLSPVPLLSLVRQTYWLRWMHDARRRRRRRRLSWSADRGGNAYGTVGVLAVEVASRESSRWEGRGEREREREEWQEEGEGERHAPVEEALYTGWILVRPSVSRLNLRHWHREHCKHSQLSKIAIIWAAKEVYAKGKRFVRSDSHFALAFSSAPWKRDNP